MISEIFRTIIEGLRYVKNIYTLIGFLCLLCVYLITHYHIEPSERVASFIRSLKIPISIRLKRTIVFLLFVSIIIMVGLLAKEVYDTARYERQRGMTRHIAKGCLKEMLNKRVRVQLLDVITLETQGDNRTLGDAEEREHIYRHVFEKARVPNPAQAARDAMTMDEDQWNEFLEGLSRRSCLIIEHTPFAKFRIYVDGKVDSNFENRYYFKGDDVEVRKEGTTPIVKFRLKHVYDAYDRYSGEREAVIIQATR